MVDNEMMRVVTDELADRHMENKIEGESIWADTPIATNHNQYVIAINHIRAKSFAGKSN